MEVFNSLLPVLAVFPDLDLADLAADSLGKLGDKFDDPRIFVRRLRPPYTLLQFGGKLVACGIFFRQNDRGLDDLPKWSAKTRGRNSFAEVTVSAINLQFFNHPKCFDLVFISIGRDMARNFRLALSGPDLCCVVIKQEISASQKISFENSERIFLTFRSIRFITKALFF